MDSLRKVLSSKTGPSLSATVHGTERSHQSLLEQCDTWESQCQSLQTCIKEYCQLLLKTSKCVLKMSEAYAQLLQGTPFWQASLAFQQTAETQDDVTRRAATQLHQEVKAQLKGFSQLIPEVRGSVQAHQRCVGELASCHRRVEQLQPRHARDQRHSDDGKLQNALERLRGASQEFTVEDERLSGSWATVEETKRKLVGEALLCSMQRIRGLLSKCSDQFEPLSRYERIGDEKANDVEEVARAATAQWLVVSQMNKTLRESAVLSRSDIQCITLCHRADDMPDAMREALCQKIDILLEDYGREFEALPSDPVTVPAGFHLNPKGIELALKGCCSDLEAKVAGAGVEYTSPDDLRRQMLLDLPRSQCWIGGKLFDSVTYSQAEETLAARLDAVQQLIDGCQDILVSVQPTTRNNTLAMKILAHTCHTVSNASAKTAVQLIYGKAHLVLIKPSSGLHTQHAADISRIENRICVSVPSTWSIVEDAPTFGAIHAAADPTRSIGEVMAAYHTTFDLSIDETQSPLPYVDVTKLSRDWSLNDVSSLQGDGESQLQRGLRGSLNRAVQLVRRSRREDSRDLGSMLPSSCQLQKP